MFNCQASTSETTLGGILTIRHSSRFFKPLPLFAAFLLLLLPALDAEEFLYRHAAGDRYRILSTVHEDVYVNDEFSHHAEILNRVAVMVDAVEGDRARLSATFLTAEEIARSTGEAGLYSWSTEYPSVFTRDRLGRMTIGPEYFMPVVRDVPLFPGRDLRPGDTWSAPGHEVHDFREPFGIALPWRVPFTANYRYLGTREWRGKAYPAFSVSYQIDHRAQTARNRVQPRRIRGTSEETVYWDPEIGQPRYYTEMFTMLLELSNGYTMEFRGSAEAELLESETMNRETLAEEIARELSGIEGAAVEATESGVTIVLEDIRFAADSAELLPGEQEKLDRIGEILRRHADRDILVEGHTALAGNAAGRERLSLERAGTVADYLVERGVRSRERVMLRGHGATRPRAANDSEEGRRRNRRVEITILEN